MPSVKKQFISLLVACFLLAQTPCAWVHAEESGNESGSAPASKNLQRLVDSGDVQLVEKAPSDAATVVVVSDPGSVSAGEGIFAFLALVAEIAGIVDLGIIAVKLTTKYEMVLLESSKIDDPALRQQHGERLLGEANEELIQDLLGIAGGAEGVEVALRVALKSSKGIRDAFRQLLSFGAKATSKSIIGKIMPIVNIALLPDTIDSITQNLPRLVANIQRMHELAPTWQSEATAFTMLTSQFTPGQQLLVLPLLALFMQQSELVSNGEFSRGFDSWSIGSATMGPGSLPFVASSLGQVGPNDPPPGLGAPTTLSVDNLFAVVHTGLGDPNNLGFIEQELQVGKSARVAFNIRYNFVSREFPRYSEAGTPFNDTLRVSLSGPAGRIVVNMVEQVEGNQFQAATNLSGALDQQNGIDGGQLGWKTESRLLGLGNDLLLSKGSYTLRVEVRDVGDNIFDSAVLVDRVSLR